MKVKIATFLIDFNEEVIKKSRKASYISSTVKSLKWTGIDPQVLTEKVTEVYHLVKGAK